MPVRALPIALALVAAGAPAASAEHFGFRGADLGMSLAEWKAAPAPAQLLHPGAAACTDDQPTARWADRLTPTEAQLGVVACVYLALDGGYPVGHRLGEGEITGATYKFLDGRLYRIELVAMALCAADVAEALRARFGPPAEVREQTAVTPAGAAMPQRVEVWAAPDARVTTATPALRPDRMTVTYVWAVAAAKVEAARRATGADAL